MKYPAWFPYPSAWFKALILFIALIPLQLVLKILGLPAIIVLAFTPSNDWHLAFVVGTAIVLLGIFPCFFLAHTHQFLWEEPNPKFPKWLPSLKSWSEGLWSWLVLLISISIVLALFIAHRELVCDHRSIYYRECFRLKQGEGQRLTVLMFILSAYLFHVRILVTRFWTALTKKQ